MTDNCQECDKKAEVGVHGFEKGEILSQVFCKECYNKLRKEKKI